MKLNLLLFLLLSFVTACDQSISSQRDKSGQLKSSHDIIYENPDCLDLNDKTVAKLVILPPIGPQSDSVQGKAFFSSSYLRELAICNAIDYKLSLNIFNKDNRSFYAKVGVVSDTVSFSVPRDSLPHVMEGDKKKYFIRAVLIASYNNGSETFGYDTSMLVKLNVKR